MAVLLSRDDFREAVFARDKHTCVFCEQPAQDAHHILERRLWPDGGYYLDNGASVCGKHHIMCETTEIAVEDVRLACGITKVVVPDHMYPEHKYDKWGNSVLPNGLRTKGELFHNESVQKILRQGGMIELFTDYVKYPRTFHLPWSGCVHSDDKVSLWMDNFTGKRVVVTEKLDGENTSLYSDHYHARSVDSRHHPSRNWAKAIWGNIAHDIPYQWRLCCENMFARHSVEYHELESFLYGLSIWNEKNECLPWDDTVEWFALFGIPSVPVLFDGIYDEETIKALYDPEKDWAHSEGYVVRLAGSFAYGDFRKSVAKYVRQSHLQTAKYWKQGQCVEQNKLK